jgi:hypothetical protein
VILNPVVTRVRAASLRSWQYDSGALEDGVDGSEQSSLLPSHSNGSLKAKQTGKTTSRSFSRAWHKLPYPRTFGLEEMRQGLRNEKFFSYPG